MHLFWTASTHFAATIDGPIQADPVNLAGPTFTADSILSPYIYVFYAAFLISFFFTPIMRIVATYHGIIDQPDRVRKMHSVPVAYLGGLAVFLGWIAGLALSQLLQFHRTEPGLPAHLIIHFNIVIAASIIVVLGLWDDIHGVRPRVKVGIQVLAALILFCWPGEGIGAECAMPLLAPISTRLTLYLGWPPIPHWLTATLSAALVIGLVVGCCNATNLMDGLDGLCGGVTAVIAAGFLFLAVHLAMSSGGADPNTDGLRVVMALALLGAVLGFVPFNFNPASIFMGDTGSMFLGFCCATMIILSAQGTHPKWFLAALVMFALPILDTALAFARRWVNGRSIFSADRHHFHHQMVARGFSVRQTVMISYGLAFFFAICGGAVIYMRARYATAFYLVIFGSIIVAAYKMGMVHEKTQVVDRKPLDEQAAATDAPEIEPSSVIEIRTDRPALGLGHGLDGLGNSAGRV